MPAVEGFPDQIHVDKIRERLWTGREFGQAAVMIGAGVSLNASKVSMSGPSMPLWSALVGQLYEQLYPPVDPGDSEYKRRKAQATAGNAALRLGSEYEATFGRHELDALLLRSIPDSDYMPGRIQELLLALPWADVFTTNYDTLLERTLPRIHHRKYDVIETAEKIPGSMQPRIVKLHGSFPSHRPFIFTEEDFRTFPQAYAPFVNLVQGSIMANAFCLLGFSGDDPNFLAWTGWVRDQLGAAMPPIYLCGLFNFAPSFKKLLENRGIIPIDLSPLFPPVDFPDRTERHAKALEWFLLNLRNGEPPNRLVWPLLPSPRTEVNRPDLPKIPEPPTMPVPPGDPRPVSSTLEPAQLQNLCATWRRKREEYPGWIIAPEKNRHTLWRSTERWVDPVLEHIDKLDTPQALFLLHELNWRLETSLVPLFMHWVERIVPVLASINPFPDTLAIPEATILPNVDEYKVLDWVRIRESWVELVFAVAREAREDQDEVRFRLWMDRLSVVTKQYPEWYARWCQEECLFHLCRFDQHRVRATLAVWPCTGTSPMWEIRRSALLAELGLLEDAARVAEDALSTIRSRLQPFFADYTLLSQEGWAMFALTRIQQALRPAEFDPFGLYRDRLEYLSVYHANPWPQVEMLEAELRKPRPEPTPAFRRTRVFDPGRVSETYHMAIFSPVSEVLPAFAYLRMLENGGVPMRCGLVYIGGALAAASWIEQQAPMWSLSTLVRSAVEKQLQQWSDRVLMATLSSYEVASLAQLFQASLLQAVGDLQLHPEQINRRNPGFSARHVPLAAELLSRLSIRFSAAQRAALLDITCRLYEHPIFRQDLSLHHCIKVLFDRLLPAAAPDEVLQHLPRLLALPIPGERGFDVAQPYFWPEPFRALGALSHSHQKDTLLDPSTLSDSIAHLIVVASSPSSEARGRAVIRLTTLHDLALLNPEQRDAFARTLWSRIDIDTGLPSETGLLLHELLTLPEGEPGQARTAFRAHLLASLMPRAVHHVTTEEGPATRVSGGGVEAHPDLRAWLHGSAMPGTTDAAEQQLVAWSPSEVMQLLRSMAVVWEDERQHIQDDELPGLLSMSGAVREHWEVAAKVLEWVVLPRLIDADDETKTLARRFVDELQAAGVAGLTIEPAKIFIDSSAAKTATQRLGYGLTSMDVNKVSDAVDGIVNWLYHANEGRLPDPPPDLLKDVVSIVRMRRQPGLTVGLKRLAKLVRDVRVRLDDADLEALVVALEQLAHETELPRKEARLAPPAPFALAVGDRPETRSHAARLAYELYTRPAAAGHDLPPPLLTWQEICRIDPLPEVRHAWPQ